MNKELSEEDIIKIAAQLRKPEGKLGTEIGDLMNEGNEAMNLHTIAVLNPQPNESILEIGMGNGNFVKNIVRIDPTIKYIGCDYSELMVKKATEKNVQFIEKKQVNFVHANTQKLPFENNSFDKIFTINTFYFWDDHTKVLDELQRVLKINGTLILSVRPKRNMEMFPVTKYDFSIYANEEIIELLKSNGFKSIETTEIKEPPQESSGQMLDRETLILACKR